MALGAASRPGPFACPCARSSEVR